MFYASSVDVKQYILHLQAYEATGGFVLSDTFQVKQ